MDQHHGNSYENPSHPEAHQELRSEREDRRTALNNQEFLFPEPFFPTFPDGNRVRARAHLRFQQLHHPPLHPPIACYYPPVMHPSQNLTQTVPLSPPMQAKSGKRLIVIDGSNVAMSHGNDEFFSWPGIDICVRLFVERGHRDVVAFVPGSKKEFQKTSPNPARDQAIIEKLVKANHLKFTPARKIQRSDGSQCREISYDDPVILSMANDHDGVVVSNDFFRDLINVDPRFRKVIEERAIGFTFYKNTLCIPTDLHGRKSGMTVEQLLDRNATSRPPGTPAYPISITVNEYENSEFSVPLHDSSRKFFEPAMFQSRQTQFDRPVEIESSAFSPAVATLQTLPPSITALPGKQKLNRKQKKKLKNIMSLSNLHVCLADGLTCSNPDCNTHLTKSERKTMLKAKDKLYSFLEEATSVLPPVTMCIAGRLGEPLRFQCLLCVRSFKRESHLMGHLNTHMHYVNLMIRDQAVEEFRTERYEMLRKGRRQK